MRRNFLPIVGLLSLFVLGACSAKRDPKIASLKHALEVADSQLLDAAAELDTTNCFPRSLMPKFRAVDAKDWTSGFFPGSLWQCYRFTGDEKLLAEAEKYTARLEGIQYYKGTHDLGFMVFCSFGQQMQTLHDRHSEEVIVEAAKSLVSRCDPRIGLIRSWDFGEWNYPVIIDNMMNLELLMWAADRSGDKSLRDMAVSHADKTLKHHFRPDFSSCHLVSYDTISGQPHLKQTHQGLSDSSAWSRGQAWGLYGYTCMYRLTGDARYLEQARGIAGFLINHRNMPADGIPYWDFDAPALASTPRDASAAAIMASALVELSGFVPAAEGERYMAFAEKQIRTLASPEYTAPAGENGGFILRHSTGAYPFSSEVDVPLTYADYYYLEALTRIKRRLQP